MIMKSYLCPAINYKAGSIIQKRYRIDQNIVFSVRPETPVLSWLLRGSLSKDSLPAAFRVLLCSFLSLFLNLRHSNAAKLKNEGTAA